MLAPETRKLYSECLGAPPGYRFDCGVATTFSLDLDALLALPFTLLTQRTDDPDELLRDPVKLIEGVRETTDDFTVFCEHGRIHLPDTHRILFSLLEDCIMPVQAPSGRGVFHPKLWLVRYVDEEGSPLLRALVLSRNLTFDRSWDTVLCLEGEPRKRRVPQNKQLNELITSLPDLCVGEKITTRRRKAVLELADQASRTVFQAPPGLDYAQPIFHTIGLNGKQWEPDLKGYRLLVVSPFVSSHMPVRVTKQFGGQREILARGNELDGVNQDSLKGWDTYMMDDAADGSADVADDGLNEDHDEETGLTGLHAKIMATEYGRRCRWWVGSANFTEAAWNGNNVELMVELEGGKKYFGIDQFWKSGFDKFRHEYVPSEPDPEQADKEQAQKRAEKVRDAIIATDLAIICQPAGAKYELALHGKLKSFSDVEIAAWPVTLADAHAQDATKLSPKQPVKWQGIASASVTAIIGFRVTVKYQTAKRSVRFALKVPATGFPEDRHSRILQQIITSSSGFFRYLRQLLGDWSSALIELVNQDGRPRGASGDSTDGWAGLLSDGVVLEDLVRTASREPERLTSIDRLIEELSSTEDGKNLIPPDFLILWETIRTFKVSKRGRQ